MISFLFVLLLSLIPLQEKNTSRAEIIHADRNIGLKENNEQIRILKGSVHLRKDTVNIYCDIARYYELRNYIKLEGNVLIDNTVRKLKAKQVYYYPDNDSVHCINAVRVYGVKDSLYANQLFYNLKTERSKAVDSVAIFDKKEKVKITGNTAVNNPENYLFSVSSNSFFSQIDSANNDTLKIFSDILSYYNFENSYAKAIDSVWIYKSNFKSFSDTAWYYKDDEKAILKGQPKVWIDLTVMTGNKITALFDSTKLKNVFIEGEARAISYTDSAQKEYNLIKGKSIEFILKNEEPKLIISRNNATSVYYLEDQNDEGVNYSTSDSIFVFFKNGELDSIDVVGGSEGIYYPSSYKGKKAFDE